jgi:hypothetical protein
MIDILLLSSDIVGEVVPESEVVSEYEAIECEVIGAVSLDISSLKKPRK